MPSGRWIATGTTPAAPSRARTARRNAEPASRWATSGLRRTGRHQELGVEMSEPSMKQEAGGGQGGAPSAAGSERDYPPIHWPNEAAALRLYEICLRLAAEK